MECVSENACAQSTRRTHHNVCICKFVCKKYYTFLNFFEFMFGPLGVPRATHTFCFSCLLRSNIWHRQFTPLPFEFWTKIKTGTPSNGFLTFSDLLQTMHAPKPIKWRIYIYIRQPPPQTMKMDLRTYQNEDPCKHF